MTRKLMVRLVCLLVVFGLASCAAQQAPEATVLPTATKLNTAAPEPPPPNAEMNGRAWGPLDAPIKVLKFVDFQCPTCAQYTSRYEPGIVAAYAATGKVRFEIRILTFIGPESYEAGMASLCAADQNAFWSMYHAVFINQPYDGRENTGQFTNAFLHGLAIPMGLDMAAFDQCLNSSQHKATLDRDAMEVKQYGVGRVPAIVVNGKLYDSARSADDLKKIFAQIAPNVTFGQ